MASFNDLAARIAANSAVLDHHLKSRNLQMPSFTADAPPEFPNPDHDAHIEELRVAIIDDTKALRDLALGPAQVVRELCWSVYPQLQYSMNRKLTVQGD